MVRTPAKFLHQRACLLFWNSAKVSLCADMGAFSRAEHTMQHHGATVQGPVYAGKSKRRDDSLGDGNGSTCSYNSNYKPALALGRLVSIEIKVFVLLRTALTAVQRARDRTENQNHIIATEPLLEQIKLRRVGDTETLTFDSGSATQDVLQARMPASRGKGRGHRGKGSGRYSQQLHTQINSARRALPKMKTSASRKLCSRLKTSSGHRLGVAPAALLTKLPSTRLVKSFRA